MPTDGGISTYMQKNYQDFTKGLSDLTTGGQEEARAAAARADPSNPQPAQIHIPGADEVITIIPRPAITRDMWAEHYRAEREQRESANSPEIEAEISRKQERSQQMRNSPTPESAQAFGSVLTALDNVQDELSTLAVVGRLAITPIAGMFPAVGVPIALLARASDILRLLTWLGLIAAPTYAALCEGGVTAIPAAVPALLFGRGLKNKLSIASSLNPFARAGRLKNRIDVIRRDKATADRLARLSGRYAELAERQAKKLAKLEADYAAAVANQATSELTKAPTIYNAIEAAQVTKDHFGVGLTFGGVVGTASDIAYGTAQYASGKDVQIKTPTRPELFYQALKPIVDLYDPPAWDDARAAAGVLARAPFVAWLGDTLTPEEHLEHLAAVYAAFDFLRPVFDAPNLPEIIGEFDRDTWSPPSYATFDSVRAMAPHVPDLERTRHLWPVAGAPGRLSGVAYTEIALEMATAAPERLLAGQEETWAGWACGALITRIAERAITLMTHDPDAIAWELEPAWQLAESLALASLLVNVGEDHDHILTFAADCYQWLTHHARRQVPRDVLLLIAERHGLHLIHLVPIDQAPGM